MQPLQICIGPTIRIGQEGWCLPYVGFFKYQFALFNHNILMKTNRITCFFLAKSLGNFFLLGGQFWFSVGFLDLYFLGVSRVILTSKHKLVLQIFWKNPLL